MSTAKPRILVLGDAMVDAYLDTRAVGVSDEAPVAVLDWVGVRRALGGMLNVAACLRAMDCEVHTLGLLGDDEAGDFVRGECGRLGLQSHWLRDGRPTAEKTRVLAGDDHLARIDAETVAVIDEEVERAALDAVADLAGECQALAVSDYAKGFITPRLAERLVEFARSASLPLLVDAKPAAMAAFRGASLFTPNVREATEFLRMRASSRVAEALPAPDEIGRGVARALDGWVLLTRGAEGATFFDASGRRVSHHPSQATQTMSTSGAGDVVLSALAWATATGTPWVEAADLAMNLAAKAMARPGTCEVRPDDWTAARERNP